MVPHNFADIGYITSPNIYIYIIYLISTLVIFLYHHGNFVDLPLIKVVNVVPWIAMGGVSSMMESPPGDLPYGNFT